MPDPSALTAPQLLALVVVLAPFVYLGARAGGWLVSRVLLGPLAWIIVPLLALTPRWTFARCERVIDGDTFVVRGHGLNVRVAGIECPERHSWQGQRATRIVETVLPPGRPVALRRVSSDVKWSRQVCHVMVGPLPLGPWLLVRLAAVRWDGRGGSPLKRWWRLSRWIIGPGG